MTTSQPAASFTEHELRGMIAQIISADFEPRIRAQMHAAFDELLQERLAAFVRDNELRVREFSLMERIVRVEEELKALREIEAARFETTENRFQALQREMDKRFEAMDKRFSVLQWTIGLGFTCMIAFLSFLKLWS